jgi:hypothetical protein
MVTEIDPICALQAAMVPTTTSTGFNFVADIQRSLLLLGLVIACFGKPSASIGTRPVWMSSTLTGSA